MQTPSKSMQKLTEHHAKNRQQFSNSHAITDAKAAQQPNNIHATTNQGADEAVLEKTCNKNMIMLMGTFVFLRLDIDSQLSLSS